MRQQARDCLGSELHVPCCAGETARGGRPAGPRGVPVCPRVLECMPCCPAIVWVSQHL